MKPHAKNTIRKLPQYRPNDAPYFVTFNLKGAIPEHRREVYRGRFAQYESLLHEPEGFHWLREESVAAIVFDRLMKLQQEVEELHAFTIMSNHVHLMMRLHRAQALDELMQSIKGNTARFCNLELKRSGGFWQTESFTRVLRWNEHHVTVKYIINNTVKAGLVSHWRDYRWTYLNEELWPGME